MYAILCILSGNYLYMGTQVHEGYIFSEEEVKDGVKDSIIALFTSKDDAESILHKSYWIGKGSNVSYIILEGNKIDLTNPENRNLFEVIEINEQI